MMFAQTRLPDVWLIELKRKDDMRGSFMRAYCEEEFFRHGLNTGWKQINHSYSPLPGTLRGMHYAVWEMTSL